MKKIPLLFALVAIGTILSCAGEITIVVTATPSLQAQTSPTATLIPTAIPTLPPPPPTITPPPTATPVPGVVSIWMSPDVPPELQTALDLLVASGKYVWANQAEAQVVLTPVTDAVKALSSRWVYVPVVPFATLADNVNWADIQRYWHGDAKALAGLTPKQTSPIFVAAQTTVTWLSALLGAPAPTVKIQIVPPDAVATTLWIDRADAGAWSLVPFDRLDPAMKVLTLDGADVFNRALPIDAYPPIQTFAFSGDPGLIKALTDAITKNGNWIATNRDLSKMTVIVMTGVTTLARATAYQMELEGITLPARDILPFLQDADYVHTSNETSFATDCPYPDPTYQTTNLKFCSKDSYLELLKSIKLNIVELTGNHVNDWGTDAFSHTLDLYDANQIAYFGGGRNVEDARKAILVNHNGNIIAFIGCNPVGPQTAWATDDAPGAASCDDDFLSTEIPRLKSVADVVVITLQYQEYYTYTPPADQVDFFAKYTAMGADIVIGSQAHQPQGFAFTGTGFIHYGLGNLFFDQMDDIATRQMFADKLIFYDRRHISTVLFTGIIEDYSRPRPMTADERRDFLQTIFQASGW